MAALNRSIGPSGAAAAVSRTFCPSRFALARSLFVGRPVPLVGRDDIYALTAGKNAANKSKDAAPSLGVRLLPHEFIAVREAKSHGFLTTTNFTRTSLFNTYYSYCWATCRPYIAIDRHGASVYVDPQPVLSLNKEQKTKELSKVLAALAASLASPSLQRASEGALQVVRSESLKRQEGLLMPGPAEGSNAQKVPDVGIAAAAGGGGGGGGGGETGAAAAPSSAPFTIHVTSRDQALRTARAMFSAFCATTGAATPERRAEDAAGRTEAKAAKKRGVLLRRLRALVADDVAVRNLRVAAGAVDGFVREDKAGRVKH